MRTTIRLREELLERAKRRAGDEGRTLTSLVEEGLGIVLSQSRKAKRRLVDLPISKATGGVLPGVDINNSASLLDLMEGR